MTAPILLALGAIVLCAVAILPGTLGILMYTNKIAASAAGARYIYGKSLWVGVAGVALMAFALFTAVQGGGIGWVMSGALLIFAGILVFGFFMHTKLMFKPIRKPRYISLAEAAEKYGENEEVVGVIDQAGRPWAYIARLARRPHIVYQPDGDDPFIMTHCILAHSSMSYAMQDKFRQPDITITAALANNMVFYEKSNQCSVVQIQNQSRQGTLPLKTIPTVACTLKTWSQLHPESKVWMRPIAWRDIFYLKLLARADVIDPGSPVMVYPLQNDQDNRLPMKSQGNGVEINGANRSYPWAASEAEPLIHDELGGTQILIASDANADFVPVYDRNVDGTALTFEPGTTDKEFKDSETGSVWKITGECVSGTHQGKSLTPIPHYNKIFWYVWSDFHPGTPIHTSNTADQKQVA
jgi:hypothetical protein